MLIKKFTEKKKSTNVLNTFILYCRPIDGSTFNPNQFGSADTNETIVDISSSFKFEKELNVDYHDVITSLDNLSFGQSIIQVLKISFLNGLKNPQTWIRYTKRLSGFCAKIYSRMMVEKIPLSTIIYVLFTEEFTKNILENHRAAMKEMNKNKEWLYSSIKEAQRHYSKNNGEFFNLLTYCPQSYMQYILGNGKNGLYIDYIIECIITNFNNIINYNPPITKGSHEEILYTRDIMDNRAEALDDFLTDTVFDGLKGVLKTIFSLPKKLNTKNIQKAILSIKDSVTTSPRIKELVISLTDNFKSLFTVPSELFIKYECLPQFISNFLGHFSYWVSLSLVRKTKTKLARYVNDAPAYYVLRDPNLLERVFPIKSVMDYFREDFMPKADIQYYITKPLAEFTKEDYLNTSNYLSFQMARYIFPYMAGEGYKYVNKAIQNLPLKDLTKMFKPFLRKYQAYGQTTEYIPVAPARFFRSNVTDLDLKILTGDFLSKSIPFSLAMNFTKYENQDICKLTRYGMECTKVIKPVVQTYSGWLFDQLFGHHDLAQYLPTFIKELDVNTCIAKFRLYMHYEAHKLISNILFGTKFRINL